MFKSVTACIGHLELQTMALQRTDNTILIMQNKEREAEEHD